MLPNSTTKFAQCRQGSISAMSLRLFVALIFVSFFAVSSGTVRAVSCYSDSWVDDSGVADGVIYEEGDARSGPFVVGCGVTQMYYNSRWSEFHEAEVDTTITSPNGRSITVTGEGEGGASNGTFSARAEAPLLWDWNDLGDYTVTSHHYSECPVADFGYTYYGITIGASKIVMRQVSPGSYAFRTIEPCNVRCRLDGYIARTSAFPYANLYVPFSGNRCFIGSVVAFSDFPSSCQDYYVFF